MSEIVAGTACECADRLAVATHQATHDLTPGATSPTGPELRAGVAALVVLIAGACRAAGDRARAERFLAAAERALRRFCRGVGAAERQGLLSVEVALGLLERSGALAVALAALEEALLGATGATGGPTRAAGRPERPVAGSGRHLAAP